MQKSKLEINASSLCYRLYVFRHIKDYKILVCGGDGTIGWVLQCLDNVGQDSECSSPACAIVPLGTGNDLARVLCWGSGYTGDEDPLNLLRDVIDAEEIILDRWTVVFHPQEQEGGNPQAVPNAAGKKSNSVVNEFVVNLNERDRLLANKKNILVISRRFMSLQAPVQVAKTIRKYM